MTRLNVLGRMLLALFLLISSIATYAQGRLTGRVTDGSGAVPGATVTNKSNGKITSTDLDGGFSLSGAAGDLLEFKSIGYQTKQFKVVNARASEYYARNR